MINRTIFVQGIDPEYKIIRPDKIHVHEPAKTWEQVSDYNKKQFLKIAAYIIELVKAPSVYAFGSRINGDFIDNSDYDVLVEGISKAQIPLIKTQILADLMLTVDIFVLIPNNYSIKIPV